MQKKFFHIKSDIQIEALSKLSAAVIPMYDSQRDGVMNFSREDIIRLAEDINTQYDRLGDLILLAGEDKYSKEAAYEDYEAFIGGGQCQFITRLIFEAGFHDWLEFGEYTPEELERIQTFHQEIEIPDVNPAGERC